MRIFPVLLSHYIAPTAAGLLTHFTPSTLSACTCRVIVKTIYEETTLRLLSWRPHPVLSQDGSWTFDNSGANLPNGSIFVIYADKDKYLESESNFILDVQELKGGYVKTEYERSEKCGIPIELTTPQITTSGVPAVSRREEAIELRQRPRAQTVHLDDLSDVRFSGPWIKNRNFQQPFYNLTLFLANGGSMKEPVRKDLALGLCHKVEGAHENDQIDASKATTMPTNLKDPRNRKTTATCTDNRPNLENKTAYMSSLSLTSSSKSYTKANLSSTIWRKCQGDKRSSFLQRQPQDFLNPTMMISKEEEEIVKVEAQRMMISIVYWIQWEIFYLPHRRTPLFYG